MAFLQCEIRSLSLRNETTLAAILPYDKTKKDPQSTLYLLHGRGSHALSWLRYANIELFAEENNIAVIMPQADRTFYTDMVFGGSYFTYVTEELPEFCSRIFHLDNAPEKTYVAGISMGGYGTLKCIMNYPERYAAAAAISSVTDITWRIWDTARDSPEYRDIQAVFGEDPKAGASDDLFALAPKAAKAAKKPRLFMACGDQDLRQEQNQRFSDWLKKHGYDNTYDHSEGDHNWHYFNPVMDKALAFMFGISSKK